MAELEERLAFSKRLNHALDLFGVPPKGKGRQVQVGKIFGVSQKAANKWLEGISLPDTMRIAVIAEHLKVNVEWLTYGTGPINLESMPGMGDSKWKRIPVITWKQVSESEKIDTKKADNWMWTDIECGPKTFALVVQDDSMMPRYEPGATVIFDPDHEPKNRSIVIYRWKKTREIGCAQLLIDGPRRCLKPHNPSFPSWEIDDENQQVEFCGTARQIFMTYTS